MSLVDQLMQAIDENLIQGREKESGWSEKVIQLSESLRSQESLVKEMEEDVSFLGALRAAGVDNWEGYDIACEMFEE